LQLRPPDPPPQPKGPCYATVRKRRDARGRVVGVEERVVFGTAAAALATALRRSRVSRHVNTSFLERQNATDRHRNARKRRKTYCFSKDWLVHEAVSCFTLYGYNFCCVVRTLRKRVRDGSDKRWAPRTPAMAAGLTDHVWTLAEWLGHPVPFNSSCGGHHAAFDRAPAHEEAAVHAGLDDDAPFEAEAGADAHAFERERVALVECQIPGVAGPVELDAGCHAVLAVDDDVRGVVVRPHARAPAAHVAPQSVAAGPYGLRPGGGSSERGLHGHGGEQDATVDGPGG
jgi:hypothetical protein